MEVIFIDLPKQTSIDKQNDYLHVISSNGDDKVMSIYDFFGMVVDGEFVVRKTDGSISFISGQTPPAALRNGIFRGKNLGSTFTNEQAAAIANGSFKGMFTGDFWVINSINFRIAHFNYWLNTGDTPCTTPHIVVVPDTGLYTEKMNETNTTAGGYAGSSMRINLSQALEIVNNAFGASHVLSHRELIVNSVNNGVPTSGVWGGSTVELMNEPMVFGTNYFTPANDGVTTPYIQTIDKTQLALFALCPELITILHNYWLRDVISESQFSIISDNGCPRCLPASYSLYVRPAVGIK